MYKKLLYLLFFVLVLGLTISVSEGADPSLVGWWRFEEGSGTTAFDSSGNGLDGELIGGVTWTQGRIGGGIELDGTSGYVSVPDFELTTDTITFVAWINGWKGGDWAPILSSREVGQCEMNFGDNDTLHYTWNNDDSATWGWTGGPVIPQDTWTMLAVTIDPDKAVAYVYTDDGGLTQSTNAIAHIEETVGALQIGYSYDPRYVRGIIDEAAIFNRALTETEILGLVWGVGEGYPYSSSPSPADGTLLLDTWVSLSWRAGDFAISHDVYFGDNFDDVNSGAEAVFQGNQTATFFVAGFPGFASPDGLVPGSTYYWRIDEVNDTEPNSPWKGNIWSFMIPPRTAYDPNPPDGAAFMDTETDLSWSMGFGTKLHTVYFGDNFDDINNAAGGLPQANATFDPGTLELDKTYYWRVDEFDAFETHKGDVWSFSTTLPGLGTVVSERWENISTTDLNTLKSNPSFPDSPDVTELVTSFEWDGPDTDNYGGRIHGWVHAPATGYFTFWLCSDDNGELWLSTDDDPGNVELIASESSWAGLNSWGNGEEKSEPILLQSGNKYYISALWKEGGGGDHCQVAWQGPGVPELTIIPGTNLSEFKPIQAYGANPRNGSVDVSQTSVLTWKPGETAASHDVYFGTDADAVGNADTSSLEYKGNRQLGSESYDPGKLEWDTTYYWRVDEIEADGAIQKGNVWSFTTANFLIVDDMESYNDINEGEEGSNRIYNAWLDGYNDPTNGSFVGDPNGPPFAELTIVHSGNQSMPFNYDNAVGKSEATLTLTYPRNWTENGVDTLVIWYIGDAANAAETMYVVLNGTAKVENPNPNAAQVEEWTEWKISLQDFNTNLTNVNTITLGLSSVTGGTGTIYYDDIRLYPPAP
ncbi:MAG: LamG-like jellyroll fold domain-containing protein [Planctomycetota bacterium]|jgi:hypothetical protein